jgi:tRNA threonylcarbamoyladenosine biosynthesis protein TsaE
LAESPPLGTHETASAGETEALGRRLAGTLTPGDLVLVAGEVGAGKTAFVRGACRALGVEGPVTSPTFTIGRRYDDGTVPISHLDLYRVGALDAEDPALLADYFGPDMVTFVEWPAEALDPGRRVAARVTLEHMGADRRRVTIA